MNELINIAIAIGYAYLIFAVIVAIIVFVITLRYFGKIRREMAEMEQRHKEMLEAMTNKLVNDNVLPNLGDVIDASNGQLESDISLDNPSDDNADAVGSVV